VQALALLWRIMPKKKTPKVTEALIAEVRMLKHRQSVAPVEEIIDTGSERLDVTTAVGESVDADAGNSDRMGLPAL
jgi:hypothetical protein